MSQAMAPHGEDGYPCRLVAVSSEEVSLLSSHIMHLHHELCDAHSKADHQLIIKERKLAQLSNNLACLSNMPGIFGYKRRQLGTVQG